MKHVTDVLQDTSMINRRMFCTSQAALGFLCSFSASFASGQSAPEPGELLITGFRGTRPSDPEVDTVRRYLEQQTIAGVMLLKRNIESPEKLERLLRSFRESSPELLPIISIDQEGGSVTRLGTYNGFMPWQSAANLARSGRNSTEILEYYSARAAEMASVGINLNLGPVVDLNVNPRNPIIGAKERSYGRDVEQVVQMAGLFVSGHRAGGVKTCLKHFPGHGSSRADSHKGAADIADTWSAREIAPFERLVSVGFADMMMNAHVLHPYFSDEPWLPASLSRKSVEEIREGLGFKGPIVTDDMQMGAVTDLADMATTAPLAVRAGNSLLIYSNYENAYGVETVYNVADAIRAEVAMGRIAPETIARGTWIVRRFRDTL